MKIDEDHDDDRDNDADEDEGPNHFVPNHLVTFKC